MIINLYGVKKVILIYKGHTAIIKVDVVEEVDEPQIKDITGDGIIDINDITAIKRHISAQTTGKNTDKWTLSEEKQLIADVTGDGVIDVNDIVKIKRYIAATSDESVAQKNPKWLNLYNN